MVVSSFGWLATPKHILPETPIANSTQCWKLMLCFGAKSGNLSDAKSGFAGSKPFETTKPLSEPQQGTFVYMWLARVAPGLLRWRPLEGQGEDRIGSVKMG